MSTIEETAAQIARRIADLTRANERNHHPHCDTAAIAQALLEHLSEPSDERPHFGSGGAHVVVRAPHYAEPADLLGDDCRRRLYFEIDASASDTLARTFDKINELIREYRTALGVARKSEGEARAELQQLVDSTGLQPGATVADARAQIVRLRYNSECTKGLSKAAADQQFEGGKAEAYKRMSEAAGMPPKPWGAAYDPREVLAEIQRLHREVKERDGMIADGVKAMRDIESAKSLYRHDAQATHRAVADMLGMPAGFIRAAEIGDYIKELKKRASNAEAFDEQLSETRQKLGEEIRHKHTLRDAWNDVVAALGEELDNKDKAAVITRARMLYKLWQRGML